MNALIQSMRLRTLPLSLAGVMCGGLIAMAHHGGSWLAFALLLITACSLQVLSNLSNEMGDYRSGVDGADRQGPAYGMANGLTEKQLWKAINWTVVVCAVSGLAMVIVSWSADILSVQAGGTPALQAIGVLVLGAAAIWAATHYTLGKKPYGYIGLGDLFVFIFFGLVSVWGGYFIIAHTIDFVNWLISPAVGMGLLSVGVLNINNIRDMATDKGFRKTIPLIIGVKASRWYQTILCIVGILGLKGYIESYRLSDWIGFFSLNGFCYAMVIVWRENGKKLDPALPVWSISTFVLAISTILAHYGI